MIFGLFMGKVESKTAGRSSSSSSSFRIYFCIAEVRPESAVWILIIKEKVNRQFDRGLFDRRNDRRNDRRTESLGPPFLFSRKIKGLDDLNLDCPRLLTPYSIHTSTQGRPPLSKCIPLLYSLLSSCQRASLVLNAPRILSWNQSMAKYVPSHSLL